MARLVRHRQTKGAETDRPILPPPRHIPTLPIAARFAPPQKFSEVFATDLSATIEFGVFFSAGVPTLLRQ